MHVSAYCTLMPIRTYMYTYMYACTWTIHMYRHRIITNHTANKKAVSFLKLLDYARLILVDTVQELVGIAR